MNLEDELLEKFQVEELENRFEMGWITPDNDGIDVGAPASDPCFEDPTCGGMIHWVTPEEKAAQQAAGG